MKKPAMILAAVVFATSVGTLFSASAGHCGSGSDRAHSPFGSCENGTPGQLECGSGTSAEGFTISSQPWSGNGAEVCAEDSSPLPFAGRAGVWVQDDGTITVYADGDDQVNDDAIAGWSRVDVKPTAESCRVHLRRGDQGQWANDRDGSTNSSTHTNQCAG